MLNGPSNGIITCPASWGKPALTGFELALQEQSGGAVSLGPRESVDRRMGPVADAEGVVDVGDWSALATSPVVSSVQGSVK